MKYCEAAQEVQPKTTFESVVGRFKSQKSFNEELMEMIKERAAIEDNYSKTLAKLHRKMSATKRDHLGEFLPVWEYILNEILESANSKTQLSLQLMERLEKIIKSVSEHAYFPKSKQYENSLPKVIKDYEEKKTKFSKYQKVFDEVKPTDNDAKSKKQRSKLEQMEVKYSAAQENLQQIKLKWDVEAINFLTEYEEFDKFKCMSLKTFSTEYCILLRQSYLKYNENLNIMLTACEAFDPQLELDRFANQLQEKVFDNGNPNGGPGNIIGQSNMLMDMALKASNEAVNNVNGASPLESDKKSVTTSKGDAPVDEDGFSKAPEDSRKWPAAASVGVSETNNYFSDSDEEEKTDVSAQKFVIAIKKDAIEESPVDLVKAVQNVAIGAPSGKGRRAMRKLKTLGVLSDSMSVTSGTSGEESNASPGRNSLLTPQTSYSKGLEGSVHSISLSSKVSLEEIAGSSKVTEKSPIQFFVTETVNHFMDESGNLRMNIIGEMCLGVESNLQASDPNNGSAPLKIILRHGKDIDRILANPKLLKRVNSANAEVSEYEVSWDCIRSNQMKKAPVIKYTVDPRALLDLGSPGGESTLNPLPILVNCAWKCESKVTLLMINYEINKSFIFHSMKEAGCSSAGGSEDDPVSFSDLSLIVPVNGIVESFQSKPTGQWNAEFGRMLWTIPNVSSKSAEERGGKLLAKFEVGSASSPAPAAIRFNVEGSLASSLFFSTSPEFSDQVFKHCSIISGRVFVYPSQ